MFSEEQYATSLAKFLSDFDYAIVDTCSLMDDAFPKWMDILHGAKDQNHQKGEMGQAS